MQDTEQETVSQKGMTIEIRGQSQSESRDNIQRW